MQIVPEPMFRYYSALQTSEQNYNTFLKTIKYRKIQLFINILLYMFM